MTTEFAAAYQFPAGVRPGSVLITPAGQAALDHSLFNPVRYEWDLLALQLDGPILDRAGIVDSYTDLTEACRAATEINRRAKASGERTIFLVQRHPETELQAAIEF